MKILILLSALLWIGCQPITPPTNSTDKYFNLSGFVQELLIAQTKLKSNVVKITQVNNVEERNSSIKADSTFWAIELSPLLNVDLNKPSLADAYSVQSNVSENSSNLLKTVFTALPESKTNITLLEVKYLKNPTNIREVIAHIQSENSVYTTHQVINLWLNKYGNQLLIDSIYMQGFNKTILLDSMKYSSKVLVVR